MDIESQSLTTCRSCSGWQHGCPRIYRFKRGGRHDTAALLNQVGALAMTLPELINKALQSRFGDHTLRYAYPLASWTVERSSDPGTGMMTLSTTDGFSVCFSMERELQHTLAEALASDGQGEPARIVNPADVGRLKPHLPRRGAKR